MLAVTRMILMIIEMILMIMMIVMQQHQRREQSNNNRYIYGQNKHINAKNNDNRDHNMINIARATRTMATDGNLAKVCMVLFYTISSLVLLCFPA